MSPKYDINLDRYLKEYQANPRSRVFAPLAEAYRKSGLVDEAIEICKEGLEYHPNFISGMVALSRCYFDKGQYTAAIKELEKVVSEVPDNFLAQKLLAESYSLMGDTQNSLKSYKMVLFLNPKDEDAKKIVSGMESSPSTRPSEATVAKILGENTKPKDEAIQEDHFPPLPPLIKDRPPTFELKKEVVNNLLNELDLGFEERPANKVFNVVGEEEQEKILTDIGTSTMGELLERQGHKHKALEVYKKIYNQTLDEKVKEKIQILEASLGIKEYNQTTPQEQEEELPDYESYNATEEIKEPEPQIIVYKAEPVLEQEQKKDEQWISPTQNNTQEQRLKMLQELLNGFQEYKRTATGK